MGAQKWKFAHDALDYAATLWDKGALSNAATSAYKKLHSNEAINPVTKAIMSPIGVIGGAMHGKGIGNMLEKTYGTLNDPNVANIAGSAFTGAVGMATLSGLTHDSSGNPDIAGIPGI